MTINLLMVLLTQQVFENPLSADTEGEFTERVSGQVTGDVA